MARILSHVWSNIRGSVGGITYFPNQFHQIVARQRTTPVNPSTHNQDRIRACMSIAQNVWESLAQQTRDVWTWYAENTPISGPLGNYTLTGRTMFIRCYTTALYLDNRGALTNSPPQTTGPAILGVPSFGAPTFAAPSIPGTGFNVVCDNEYFFNSTLYLQVAGPFESSRLRFKGPFSSAIIHSVNAAPAAQFDLDVLNLVDDKIYFVKMNTICDAAAASPCTLGFPLIYRVLTETTAI